MITSVAIKNFRSIENMELQLGKINVLTGANNSGKSSVIYALLALKNAVENQNQTVDEIFNLGFIDLGGHKQVVHRRLERLSPLVFINTVYKEMEVEYGLEFYHDSVLSHLSIPAFSLSNSLHDKWPIQSTTKVEIEGTALPESYTFLWDGFTVEIVRKKTKIVEAGVFFDALKAENQNDLRTARAVMDAANSAFDEITSIEVVPVQRGFTKARFSPVSSTGFFKAEAEIANLLYTDRDLTSDVAHFLEKIVARRFEVRPIPNTTNFYLQTRDEKTGFTADLVNEGLGTNQLVTILAKALYKNASFICIDEPEIHLHPSIIDKLVNVLIDIANDRGKQFLISTHSEHFVTSLMTAVVKKRLTPDELKIYHLTKEGWDTKAEEQKVNEQGQLSGGGLSHFYESELANLTAFFGLDK